MAGEAAPLEPGRLAAGEHAWSRRDLRLLQNAENIRARFAFVEDSEAVADALFSRIGGVPAAGKQVHDANIVATMHVYGIRRLLSNNEAHFTRFSHLITVVPLRSFL